MQANILEVFNTYNVNILFTVAALPARVALGLPMGAPQLLQMPPPTGTNQVPAGAAGGIPPVNRGAIPAGQAAPRTAP